MFVVGAIDIDLRSSVAPVAIEVGCELFLESLCLIGVGENIFLANVGGTLQRRARGVVPHTLKVRITPWRMKCGRFLVGRDCLLGSRRGGLGSNCYRRCGRNCDCQNAR